MKYVQVRNPRREARIGNINLLGHRAVSIEFHYSVEGNRKFTTHTQVIELSLCDIKYLSKRLNQIGNQLQALLDDFRNALRGVGA